MDASIKNLLGSPDLVFSMELSEFLQLFPRNLRYVGNMQTNIAEKYCHLDFNVFFEFSC